MSERRLVAAGALLVTGMALAGWAARRFAPDGVGKAAGDFAATYRQAAGQREAELRSLLSTPPAPDPRALPGR
ncbi:MAG TPA: hypothetical protein VES95_05065 [Dermatophilaceae bacterium]|nr:hypothetical protein [Dermatophilaceae bacterium]